MLLPVDNLLYNMLLPVDNLPCNLVDFRDIRIILQHLLLKNRCC